MEPEYVRYSAHMEQIGLSTYASDLHSRVYRFESWPGHQVNGQNFCGFSSVLPGKSGTSISSPGSLLPRLFQFVILLRSR